MKSTAIAALRGRRVWDSRGRPTVEAEVRLEGGGFGRAIAPSGASTGKAEAVERRDGGAALGGADVRQAVAAVNGEIGRALKGRDAADQEAIDRFLIALDGTPQKSRLGANALVAVSLAVLEAAADAAGVPLYAHLSGGAEETTIPLPEIQIFGGGAHAGRRIDIQDLMIVAPFAPSFAEALVATAEVYRAAGAILAEKGSLCGLADEGGFWPSFSTNEEALETLVKAIQKAGFQPGEEIFLSLDIAASQFFAGGLYRLGLDRRALDRDGMAAMLAGWLERYPIASIEDPFAEEDLEGWRRFTAAFGEKVQIVGDDLLVTNDQRIRKAAAAKACNAVLVKPNQAGTVSEARRAFAAAREAGFSAIASARSGESEDVSIVHLAVGWGIPQLKVGSFARSERMAKWNEALRIEEALEGSARFAGAEPLRLRR